jgi:hypothetical protein
VGIGTTNISEKLTINGNLAFANGPKIKDTSGKLGLQAGGTGTGAGGTGSIYFLDSSANVTGRFDTTGTTTPLGTGTGADGALSLSNGASNNCNTTALAAGRTSGDCIAKGLSITAPAATTTMPLSSVAGLAADDEVLIIQMTGTGAGSYEFMTIDSIIGTTLVFDHPLANTYTIDSSSKAQIVRVPQYTTLTLNNSGTTLTTSAWNGTTGGVLPFRANSTVTIAANTSITVASLGFSGASTVTGGTGQNGCAAGCAGSGGASVAGGGGQSPFGTASNGGGAGGNPGNGGPSGGNGGSGAGGTGGGGAGGTHASAGTNGTAGVSGAGGASYSGSAAGGTGSAGAAGAATSTTYGTAGLTTMFAGSGGGAGASGAGGGAGGGDGGGGFASGGNGGTGGAGGAGGGILFMEVNTINNSGSILADGSAGTSGGNGATPSAATGNAGGGGGGAGGAAGGGGAGGSLYLKVSNTVTAIGTVSASGGAGGAQGGTGGNGGLSPNNGGGGGAAGRTGGSAGNGSGGTQNGSAGATAAPGPGGAGSSGRVRCDTPSGSCSTTPTANQNVYTSTGIPTTNGYGVFYVGAVNTVSADLAEYYVTGDRSLEAGDLVCLSNARLLDDGGEEVVSQGVLRKCKDKNDPLLIGIISTQPGVTLGSIDSETHKEDHRALALSGRVPAKVSTENGEIKIGDYLTSSSIPGVAMKATGFAKVVGMAMENYSGGPSETGRIMVFINLQSNAPVRGELVFDLNGRLVWSEGTTTAAFATSTEGVATTTASSTDGFLLSPIFTRIWEGLLSKLSDFGVLISESFVRINNLFVSSIHIENELCIDDVCINKEQLKALIIQAGATAQASTTPETEAPTAEEPAPAQSPEPTPAEEGESATSTPPLIGPDETATSTPEVTSNPDETATSTPPLVSEPSEAPPEPEAPSPEPVEEPPQQAPAPETPAEG